MTRLLITGGATGFGKAMALCWAKHHQSSNTPLRICIADIHQERGQETVNELKALGAEALFSECDITNIGQIKSTQALLMREWQGVDIVINNAGVATGGSLKSESLEQWQWVFNINLFGMVQVSQVFVDVFREQGHGYFINVASQAGVTPVPLMGSYNAVKAAVVSFSETMKLELASDNIDVSVVCPSFFKTHLNESMKTSEPIMKESVNRLFAKAEMTAEQVAHSVYQQAQDKRFLILTHKQGKLAYLMKKFLPFNTYLNRVIASTAKMVSRAKQATNQSSNQSSNLTPKKTEQ